MTVPFFTRIKNALRYDLDAYLLFRDQLADHDYPPVECDFGFSLISGPDVDHRLQALCVKGGYLGSTPEAVADALKARFDQDQKCVVAIAGNGNDYVAMSWIGGPDPDFLPPFARFLKKTPDTGLLHMTYVLREYRGNHLQRYLDAYRKQELKGRGLHQSVSCVGVKNFASIRSLMATNDEYRLIYNLTIDIPFVGKISLYPKWDAENWCSCRKNTLRWYPPGPGPQKYQKERMNDRE